MKPYLFYILILGIFFLFPLPAQAATYYVSPSGSGTACTATNPCSLSYYQSDDYTNTKHINLVAGDFLYFKSGTYIRQARLDFSTSGSSASHITIMTAPGEPTKAIISGDVNGNGVVDGLGTIPGSTDGPRTLDPVSYHKYYPLVRVQGSYVTVKNIEIAFSSGRGIQSEGINNLLSGIVTHHIWNSSIHLFGSYSTVENSTIWRGGESNYCGGTESYRQCNGDWPGGLDIGDSGTASPPGSGHHSIIRGNTIYNVSGEGILCMHNDYSTIENNIVYDNWAQNVDLDKCSYTTVKNNLIYYTDDKIWWRSNTPGVIPSSPKSGIVISNEYTTTAGDPYPLGHDRIITNNIIVGAGANINFWAGDGTGGMYDQSSLINDLFAYNTLVEAQNGSGFKEYDPHNPVSGYTHINTRFVNNLVLQTNGNLVSGETLSGISFDNNLWSNTPISPVLSETDIIADPLLIDPNHVRIVGQVIPDWYKLNYNSPAINKAVVIADIFSDFWGNTRDTSPDIGAHEYTPDIVPTPTQTTIKPGDANEDGYVNEIDYLNHWLPNYGKLLFGHTFGDFDENNIVDGIDYVIWLNNFEG